MSNGIRKLSPSGAAKVAEKIALSYAVEKGIEGKLLSMEPDKFSTERRGKIPVHWVAVFESVHHGAALDGPLVMLVNLETNRASLTFSP
jgi:hypothetical protein